jgi:hypothetical protein
MNKVPNILLPANATLNGIKITAYPSFDGHPTFSFKDGFNRDRIPTGQIVIFDEFPNNPVMLDRKLFCWVPA